MLKHIISPDIICFNRYWVCWWQDSESRTMGIVHFFFWKGKVWSIARFRLYPVSRVSGRGPAGLPVGKPKLLLSGESLAWPGPGRGQCISGSECGRNRPGFGWQAVSQKLPAIQYYRVLNIQVINLKLYNVLQCFIMFIVLNYIFYNIIKI